jgi:hypothetical protein
VHELRWVNITRKFEYLGVVECFICSWELCLISVCVYMFHATFCRLSIFSYLLLSHLAKLNTVRIFQNVNMGFYVRPSVRGLV